MSTATLQADRVRRLMADPIIQAMAAELRPDWRTRYTYSGTDAANYLYQAKALDEYRDRGGRIACHFSGPAAAVIRVRKGEA